MTFEDFYKEIIAIMGRLIAVLVFRNAITQKDADFINGKISEEEWCEDDNRDT